MDANTLHQHKENIQPLPRGRAASKLGLALSEGARNRAQISKLRDALEASLLADDLDDPLQAYIDYIDWTHNHYPQGSTGDSGLLKLLERCTSCFRDTLYYKNDPRYLKVWLEYAAYSDLPRDIFVYLAKKEIGVQLALYYEEFARFLEASGAFGDAKQVYDIGIERNARPQPRLLRNYEQFQKRVHSTDLGSRTDMWAVLKRKVSVSPLVEAPATKRPKVLIFRDEVSPTLKETVFSRDPDAWLGSIASGRKENVLTAKTWAGEVQTQKIPTDKTPAKFQVFRDPEETDNSTHRDFEVVKTNDGYCSVVRQPGKPVETVLINMDLVYPSAEEEYCFAEILALSRRFSHGKHLKTERLVGKHDDAYSGERLRVEEPRVEKKEEQKNKLVGIRPFESRSLESMKKKESIEQKRHDLSQLEQRSEENHTFTIPLRDDDTTQRPASPTMTMFSQMTTKEVLGMFNEAAHAFQLDDESTRGLEESTNYDGFVTETININNVVNGEKSDNAPTPPTDHYDSDGGSLPFVERPGR